MRKFFDRIFGGERKDDESAEEKAKQLEEVEKKSHDSVNEYLRGIGVDPNKANVIYNAVISIDPETKKGTRKSFSNYHDFFQCRKTLTEEQKREVDGIYEDSRGNKWRSPQTTLRTTFLNQIDDPENLLYEERDKIREVLRKARDEELPDKYEEYREEKAREQREQEEERKRTSPPSAPREEQREETAPEEFPLLAEKRRAYVEACNTYRRMFGKPPKEKIIADARRFVTAGDNERLNPLFYDEEARQAKLETEKRREEFHTELFHKGIKDKDQRIILYDIELAKADYEAEKLQQARELFSKNNSEAEIFQKFIIQEQELLAREKLESWPPKEKGIVKKGLDFWMRQNRYVRIGVSTAIATGVFAAASGALTLAGAPTLALFAGQRYARGLASAVVSQAAGKGIEWVNRKKGTNPGAIKERAIEELKSDFSIENLRDVEKEYQRILEKEARSKRINLVEKTALMALAGFGTVSGIHILEEMAGGGTTVTQPEHDGKPPAESGEPSVTDKPAKPSEPTQPEPTEPPLSDQQKFENALIDDPDFAKNKGWDGKTPLEEWAKGKAHELVHPEEIPPAPEEPVPSPQEQTPPEKPAAPSPEPAPKETPPAEIPQSEIESNYIKIEARGPEGMLIDYFKEDPDLAKRYGWDGETDLSKWAGMRAHQLWQDYSEKALADPETIKELERLGYEPTPKGYADMMNRIQKGYITLDAEAHEVQLGDMTYGRAPLYHEVFHEPSSGGAPVPEIVKPPVEALPHPETSIAQPEVEKPYSPPPPETEEPSPAPSPEILPENALKYEQMVTRAFGFEPDEYEMMKDFTVKEFLEKIPPREEAWQTFGELLDKKAYLLKQIQLAEYIRGLNPNEYLQELSIEKFLQTEAPGEWEGLSNEQIIIGYILRFEAPEYDLIQNFTIEEFLERIPPRSKVRWMFINEYFKKQLNLKDYIESFKLDDELKKMTIQEFLRKP